MRIIARIDYDIKNIKAPFPLTAYAADPVAYAYDCFWMYVRFPVERKFATYYYFQATSNYCKHATHTIDLLLCSFAIFPKFVAIMLGIPQIWKYLTSTLRPIFMTHYNNSLNP